MTKKLTVGLALLALGAVATLVFAEKQGTNTAPATTTAATVTKGPFELERGA